MVTVYDPPLAPLPLLLFKNILAPKGRARYDQLKLPRSGILAEEDRRLKVYCSTVTIYRLEMAIIKLTYARECVCVYYIE